MNSSLIGEVSEFVSRFHKFPVFFLNKSLDQTLFSISRDKRISESRVSKVEIPLP